MFRRIRRNEGEILKQLHAGNEKVLVDFFERNYLSARNYLMRQGASDEAIREVLEDAVIDYWEAVQGRQTQKGADEYILEAVEHRWLQYQLLHKKATTAEEEDLKNNSKKLNDLANYVKMQNDTCRELLSLYYFEKWDNKSISEKTGLRPEEIEEKVFQCKRKLAQSVKRNISLRNLI